LTARRRPHEPGSERILGQRISSGCRRSRHWRRWRRRHWNNGRAERSSRWMRHGSNRHWHWRRRQGGSARHAGCERSRRMSRCNRSNRAWHGGRGDWRRRRRRDWRSHHATARYNRGRGSGRNVGRCRLLQRHLGRYFVNAAFQPWFGAIGNANLDPTVRTDPFLAGEKRLDVELVPIRAMKANPHKPASAH
jgi:hypothetical protein